tara:strand:- start:46 stop:972 length:927 start_codon:yes stop_codon:yes gene_type:complete
MGSLIIILKRQTENIAKGNKLKLYIGGFIIALILIFSSGTSGWLIERIFLSFQLNKNIFSQLFFTFFLSSALATKSLNKSVNDILNLLIHKNAEENLDDARGKLSLVVGRDTQNLDKNEILRATAETASENSVDGIFAPLFWMFIGIIHWQINQSLPGPLAMAWIFKASSTIDSMIGYKEGDLRWLGFAGAKLDDLLTWVPSKLVLITLPFCCRPKLSILKTIKHAWNDGIVDASPNSGISEAIFAHCVGVKMGGINFYKGKKNNKAIIAKSYPNANNNLVKKILTLSLRLQVLWIFGMTILIELLNL